MLTVGLTGGAGSGKSTVATLLEGLGAVIIDTDVISRQVVAPGSTGLAAVVERFGPGILSADGSLDRPALGAMVFADDLRRRDLEAVLHPLIRAEVFRQTETWAETDRVVVWVVPLLVESGRYPADKVVVVDCPEKVAIARMVATRGWSEDQARGRLGAQTDRATRLAAADYVIDNSGPESELPAKVQQLWDGLSSEA